MACDGVVHHILEEQNGAPSVCHNDVTDEETARNASELGPALLNTLCDLVPQLHSDNMNGRDTDNQV